MAAKGKKLSNLPVCAFGCLWQNPTVHYAGDSLSLLLSAHAGKGLKGLCFLCVFFVCFLFYSVKAYGGLV